MRHARSAAARVFVTSALLGAVWLGWATVPARCADDTPTTEPATQPAADPPAAEWARKPPEQWPQLVLTNKATFDGHTAMNGASSFLLTMPDNAVYLATAKHLIKKAGGVDPPLAIGNFDKALQDWAAFPRTQENEAVHAKGLAVTPNHEATHDWLLLKLVDPPTPLPATPLVPRARPAQVGETVYLVGVPYNDHHSQQNVYKGTVTARPSDHYFTYRFDPAVRIAGFSGAPIVDANGLLLGHGVSRSGFKPDDVGQQTEFGGEDAAYGVRLWEHRADPPVGAAAVAVTLPLPDGWTERQPTKGELRFAECKDLKCIVELFAHPKTDYDEGTDLMAFAKGLGGNRSVGGTGLADAKATDPTPGKIGDRPTVEFGVTATLKGRPVRYRMIVVEADGCFCEFMCRATAANWDAAQSRFEAVVSALK